MGTKGTTYLGIDGGGTRCRARIEDEKGRLLGEASAGPATTRIGIEKAWQSIMEATEAAAAQAGLAREDFARTHAGLGRRQRRRHRSAGRSTGSSGRRSPGRDDPLAFRGAGHVRSRSLSGGRL